MIRFAIRAALIVVVLCSCVSARGQKTDTVKRTQSIRLKESAGIARTGEPVEVTVRFQREALIDASAIRLARVEGGQGRPVACQVLSITPTQATDSFAPAAQTFARIVFLADVPAGGETTYEVSLGDSPSPPAPATLKTSGEGLGLSIDAGPAAFELHKPSGQLLSFTPKTAGQDRLVFQQFKDKGPLPIHWNPDIWTTGGPWGHTSDWNAGTAFDPAQHKADSPSASSGDARAFFYRQFRGPLACRITRWGRMPFVPQADASVTYTFYAGAPFVSVQSLVEFREDVPLHTVRNAELVFSRHQFDTAVWIARDGKVHSAPCYDYNDKDKSFGEIARLPADVPCLALASERQGFGVALVVQSMTNLNKRTGQAADEGAHFYIRDYDEHGKGDPKNFVYFVRPLVYRDGYLPTTVDAGSLYAERSAIVVFKLSPEPERRYDELIRWQKMLAAPLEVVVD
ncbi:MAG: hypothetical protein HYS13_04255 [Planctomycetia bacterium]|nr:hypothetical protein [Planctomycetia bacterium]